MAFKYNMKHDFRGTALIIGNEFKGQGVNERSGCRKDVRMMKDVFKKLDFNVKTFMNLTAAKMREKLEQASKDEKNKNCDCFVFVVSTHGREILRKKKQEQMQGKRQDKGQEGEKGIPLEANIWRNVVFGEDGRPIPVDDIIDYFTDERAVGLVDKPKLFFIQACRSRSHAPPLFDKYDQGVKEGVSKEHVLTEKLKATGVSKDSADLIHTMDLTDEVDVSTQIQRETDQLKAIGINKDSADWIHTMDLTNADDIYKDWAKGKFAFRDDDDGSYFIMYLHNNLTKLLCGWNVLQYLTLVCKDMAELEVSLSLEKESIDDLRKIMCNNILYLIRKDNLYMLVEEIGKKYEKGLTDAVKRKNVEPCILGLIFYKLTEQQMKSILRKILPFKITTCLLHRLKDNVVFNPKKEHTPMGKLKSEIMKMAHRLFLESDKKV